MKVLFFIISLFVFGGSLLRADVPSDRLITALIRVESSGNDSAIGDKNLSQKAYGCLQVRQPVCDDINRRFGTSYKASDCLGNRELSIRLCRLYIDMYATKKRLGRQPSLQDMSRIWNGGPSGWKKKSTRIYWTKVRRALAKQ